MAAAVVLARWLGPKLYGEYATILAMLSWLLLVSEIGCNAGMQRYYLEARDAGVRYSLYRVLQLRRWAVVASVTLSAGVVLSLAGEPSTPWKPVTIALIGGVAALTLHAQLASSVLLAGFGHGRTIVVASVMTIVRAAVIAIVCVFWSDPVALVSALAIPSGLEAAILHCLASKEFGTESTRLPAGMANAAQRHGLVGMVDKIGTQVSGPDFVILVFVGVHGPAEIAMFALATGMLQKVLSVVNMPLSNLVLPVLNSARDDRAQLVVQIDRLGAMAIIVNALAIGGLVTVIPAGVPLVFGEAYAEAASMAVIWVGPLFLEAAARMVWGAALLQTRAYRWLMTYNMASGALTLAIMATLASAELSTLVIALSLLRIGFVGAILLGAAQRGLFTASSIPVRIVFVVVMGAALSWLVQSSMSGWPRVWVLMAGITSYAAVVGVAVHFLPLIPQTSHMALRRLAGRYEWVFVRLVPGAGQDDVRSA
jgi:O-antigen/teichoic acid export membrane protein